MPRLTATGGRVPALLAGAGLLLLALGPAAGIVGAKINPDIWLTSTGCGTSDTGGVGTFSVGQHVVIRGIAFAADTSLDYEIKGQPGNASADPNIVVAAGSVTTDGTGAFCVDAYVVLGDDDGTYKVSVDAEQDMYAVLAGSPAPSGSVSPSGAPSSAPSGSVSPSGAPSSAPSGSVSPSGSPSPTPSADASGAPNATADPSGGAGAETAAASLPPTDAAGRAASSDALGLVLMVLAGILAGLMVVTPARASRR